MAGFRSTIAIALATIVAVIICWGPWPLGVAGEWTWVTIGGSSVSFVAFLLIGIAGAIYIAVVDRLSQFFDARSSSQRFGLLIVLAGVVFAWFSVVREPIDWLKIAAGRSRDPWILYAPGTSGYFTQAREIETARNYLQTYQARIDKGDYLHEGTHPPGLPLLYHKIFIAHRIVPGLASVAESLMSSPVRESFNVINETQGEPLSRVERSVLWWAGAITQTLAACCVIPIGWLAHRVCSADSAWRIAALWAFVPASAVFLPKSDCLYAFFGLTVTAMWVRALERRSLLAAGVAGLVASYSLQLSLALGPVYLGVAIGTIVWAARVGRKNQRTVAFSTLVATGAGLAQLLPAILAGMNPLSVWMGNLRNHAAFYDHNPRSFLAWIPVNFVEFVMAAGLPLTAAASCVALDVFKQRRLQISGSQTLRDSTTDADSTSEEVGESTQPRRQDIEALIASIVISIGFAWLLLWLSGKNMGEAARLWSLFTPWPLITIGFGNQFGAHRWRLLAVCALIAFAALVIRIDGFDLTGRAIGL